VGKEGPSVHVACCVGNVIGQCFRKYRESQSSSFPAVQSQTLIHLIFSQNARAADRSECCRCRGRIRISHWRSVVRYRGESASYDCVSSASAKFVTFQEMSHNFSNKTMWRSFVCALVATFTLSVGIISTFAGLSLILCHIGHESVPYRKTRPVSSLV
jgi:chloride channel 3/4/5